MLERERSRRCLFIDHEVDRGSFDVSAGDDRVRRIEEAAHVLGCVDRWTA